MNNKLRRDIDAYLRLGVPTPDADPMSLLRRALEALGGPVADSRPVIEAEVERVELPEPEPLPEGPKPDMCEPYYGLTLQLRVLAVNGVWVRQPYEGLCDVFACLNRDVSAHGPYHFCNDHFGELMDNIAKEQAPMDAQIVEQHAATVGELDAYVPSPVLPPVSSGVGVVGDLQPKPQWPVGNGDYVPKER